MDYKNSGVDIEAGDHLVDWLKSQKIKWPHQNRMVSGIGGFAALFRADFKDMQSPCLVSSTDGVGTKVKLATHFKDFSSIGQDLVAMCVNDLLCAGAQPLFFLDYYACGKLELDSAKSFLTGLQNACVEAECALIGGETAEMPGVYQPGDFDCAGFSVGVVDEAKAFSSKNVKSGDRLLGVRSSGFHSNGYSLLRKVFADDLENWQKILLTPTRLYVKLIRELKLAGQINSMAHITGGGMDNLLRVLPDHFQAHLKPWSIPAEFREVKKRTQLNWEQMFKTLNCGLGLVLVVPPESVESLRQRAQQLGEELLDLGEVKFESKLESAWHINFSELD